MKTMKRLLAALLVVLSLAEILPVSTLAADAETEAQFRQELADSVSAEAFPQGMFDFLPATMQTSEDIPMVEFSVVRRGSTEGEASVDFKAIDVSARYGEDYYIEVAEGVFGEKIQKNEQAQLMIEEVNIDQKETTVVETPTETPAEKPAETPVETPAETPAETPVEAPVEVPAETPAEAAEAPVETPTEVTAGSEDPGFTVLAAAPAEQTAAPAVTDLAGAVLATTGRDITAYDWREEDQATLEAFQAASKEMYDDIEGHTITLTFAPGEYQKILRFYTVDDGLSEDDEQVMLVLSHAEGCALSENPTGYVNIVDNEPADTVTYAFAAETVTVPATASTATVELQRLGGLSRTTTVYVGTAGGSALADQDYDPLWQEIVFMPGQAAKEITVDIRDRALTEERWFNLTTEDGKASVKLVLEPKFRVESREITEGGAELAASIPTYTKTLQLSKMSYAPLGDRRSFSNGKFYANHRSITFKGVAPRYDLTMVQKLKINTSETGSGTSHTKKSGCKKKTYWSTDKYNYLYINGTNVFTRKGTYTGDDTISLSGSNVRTTVNSITFSSLGIGECYDTNGYISDNITMYYEPFFVDTAASDGDAVIYPMVYSSKDGTPKNQTVRNASGEEVVYSFTAGKMDLDTGTGGSERHRYFFDDQTIRVKPAYDSNLTAAQKAGIYLWGVKFERKGSGSKLEYYYLDKTEFNLRTLYDGGYKDFYTGETISSNCLLNSDGIRGYKILPVYRQKTSYTLPFLTDGLTLQKGTFPNDDGNVNVDNLIITGRLDQISLNAVGSSDSKVVMGWDVLHSIRDEKADVSCYVDTKLKDSKQKQTYFDRLSYVSRTVKSAWADYSNKKDSILGMTQYNYGAAVPGTLLYQPAGRYNVLCVQSMNPSITVTVNPKASPTSIQPYGVVGYQKQVAQYTGQETRADGKSYAVGSKIRIAPYTLTAYDLLGAINEDGEKYMQEHPTVNLKFVWKDFTGDTNMDGDLSDEELKKLGEDVRNAYGKLRLTYAGNVFNYVPKIVGSSIVYYQVAGKVEDPFKQNSLHGTLVLRGNTVNKHSSGISSYIETPLAGIPVQIGELRTVTDEKGHWEIASPILDDAEIYSASFTYEGRVYTDDVGVNQECTTIIDEYNTFDVRNFTAIDSTTHTNCTGLEIKDKSVEFQLLVTPAIGTIEASSVTLSLYHQNGQWSKDYAMAVTHDNIWSVTMNPRSEGVMAGDYFRVTVRDNQSTLPYLTHEVGFKFIAKLSAVNVVNNFFNPFPSDIFDYFDRLDMSLDLGLSSIIEDGEASLLKSLGITMTDEVKEGVRTKTVSWGWNKDFKSAYKPKKEDEKSSLEEAKEATREGASAAEKVEKLPKDGEKDENLDKAEKTAGEVVETGEKGKKNRSSFAANIKMDVSVAVSIEMAYNDTTNKWYFVEFLAVGKVAGKASATYSYMTPIGVKLGITATLSGDITAIMGFDPYYQDPSNPNYRYIDEGGGNVFNLIGSKKGNKDTDRDYTAYGKLIIRPTVSLSVSAALVSDKIAEVSLTGAAYFDMMFTTGQTGSGSVTLSAKLKLSLLGGLIKKEYTLAEKTWKMFEYANLSLMGEEDYRYAPITVEDIQRNSFRSSGWQGGTAALQGTAELQETKPLNERILIEDLNFDPAPVVEQLSHSVYLEPHAPQSLAVFLDAKDGSSDRLVLKYSILQDNVWSEPLQLDPTSKGDDYHSITWLEEGKLLICWSTYVGGTEGETPEGLLNMRDLRTMIVTYDATSVHFGEIKELTRTTAGDVSGDDSASFMFFRDAENAPRMMAVYKKNVYHSSGSEFDVGDALNATTTYAFRIYDFEHDCWQDLYDPAYVANLPDPSIIDEEYRKNFYGQYFFQEDAYCDAGTDLFMTAAEIEDANLTPYNSRGLGIWKREATADDVQFVKFPLTSKVTEGRAAHYQLYDHDFCVLAYAVDMDGQESTETDRELFLKVYDLTDFKEYLPIRLTKDDKLHANLILTDAADILRLYYVSGGSVCSTRLSDLLDNLLYGTKDGRNYLLEDRSPDKLVLETAVLQESHSSDLQGKTVDKVYQSFTMDWDDRVELLLYTEPSITYAEGVEPGSPEAAKPENQYAERQLYTKLNRFHAVPVSTEDGDVITYVDDWTERITVTDRKGLNIISGDAIASDTLELYCITVQAQSKLETVEGMQTPVPDLEHRKLVASTYNILDATYTDPDFTLSMLNTDELYTADRTEPFTLQLQIDCNDYLGAAEPYLYLYQLDANSNKTLVGETEVPFIDSYETTFATIDFQLPVEDLYELNGLCAELWNGKKGEKFSFRCADCTYLISPPAALEITDVTRRIVDRNHLQYTVSVRNSTNVALPLEVVTATVNDVEYSSDPFRMEAKSEKEITLNVTVPDEAFTEKRENGIITETAYISIKTERDLVQDELIRSGMEKYESLVQNAELYNVMTEAALGGSLALQTGGYLLPGARNGKDTSLLVQTASSNSSIAATDYLGGIIGKGAGTASVTLMITPRSVGTMALSAEGAAAATYNDLDLLPSALVRKVTLPVTVTGSSPVNPSGGGSSIDLTGLAALNMPFTDVQLDDYFAQAVMWAVQNGITTGVTPTTFAPQKPCTRAEIVTFLWRTAGSPTVPAGETFTDVTAGSYYATAVAWAVQNGVTKGVGGGLFAPDRICTRGQVVTFLHRFKGGAGSTANCFTDIHDGDFYYDSVLWALANGITTGTSDTTFSPDQNCTRAQNVTFLYRCFNEAAQG